MNVHRRWIYVAAGLLVLNALAMAVLVTASSRSAPLVVPRYYERAVAWDQAMADARRAAALSWTLELALSAGGALELIVRKADGQPVADVHVTGEGVHRGAPAHRLAFDVTTDADGRAYVAAAQAARQKSAAASAAASAATVRPGWYQLELTFERGAVRYSERRAALLRDPADSAAPGAASAANASASAAAVPGAQP